MEDGRAYAGYLDEAAEGFFRFMLGGHAADVIATAFTEPDHDLSYQNVTFAERDGAIVGMVSGYTAAQHRRSSDLPLRQAAGRQNLRFRVVSTVFSPLFRIMDQIGDDDYYLQAIAVDPAIRGEGIGSVLMDCVEERALVSSSTRVTLHVSANNAVARQFYERRGMIVESQWPRRLVIPKLRFLQMSRAL